MKSKSEILEQQRNANNRPITEYISQDGYVWGMILNAMEEYAQQQVYGEKNRIDLAYLIGVFNVVGVDGLSEEIARLKEIGKNPHEMFFV